MRFDKFINRINELYTERELFVKNRLPESIDHYSIKQFSHLQKLKMFKEDTYETVSRLKQYSETNSFWVSLAPYLYKYIETHFGRNEELYTLIGECYNE